MNKIPVILDCDTGVDDAVAIMLLNKLPQFDLIALTSVAGNVQVEKTTRNTLAVLELIGADIPVYKGAAIPLVRDQVIATYVHGEDGLAGINLPSTRMPVPGIAAWDAIHQEAVNHNGSLEIIAIGPLTNLALAFMKYTDLAGLIKRIVIMGGSTTYGNVTPAAEFNIFADPEAADIVFSSGVPVHMCGLDVTMQAYLLPSEVDQIGALDNPPARFFHAAVQNVQAFSIQHGLKGMCFHDPVAVLYAADPSIFTVHPVGIRVETLGLLTKGKTVTDLYSDAKWEKNGFIVTDLDREAFRQQVFDLMSQY